MNQELALRNNYIPSDSEFKILQTVSRNASASGLYSGIGSEQKIFMILLSARELGIPPMQALNGGIWNIQGKIEISARLMNAMIRRAGHSIKVVQCDETKCIIHGRRTDSGDEFTSQFTIEDAKKAGLTSRQNWKTYTEDMLYSRAMSRLARRLFPDIIGTAYVEGEIQESKILDSKNIEEIENVEEIKNEVVEIIDITQEEINAYLENNWPEEKQNFRLYLDMVKNKKEMSYRQCIEKFEEHKELTKNTFLSWLSKQNKE